MLPVAVVFAFAVHWISIRTLKTAPERLEVSRGVYLGFSFQLLLYGWFLYSVSGTQYLYVALAMTFSLAGDWCNLQFPFLRRRMNEPLLAGIAFFAAAQLLFVGAIFQAVSWEQIFQTSRNYGVLLALLVVPAAIFYFRVYNPARPKALMAAAFLYGFVLCFAVALYLNCALNWGGLWWLLAMGGGFFLLSDAVMGETTIHGGRHPAFEFQVPWFTYLIAQGFLLFGFFTILHGRT